MNTVAIAQKLVVELDDITADVVFKDIRHVYLRIHPPTGQVRIAAPLRTSPEFIRRFVGTKLRWIRKQQAKLLASPREAPRPLLPVEREALRDAVRGLIAQWQPVIGVRVQKFYLQRMKTRWGSCNTRRHTIRLSTELFRKPHECLEYIVVHELTHLLEASHNARFYALMDRFLPGWRMIRQRLNGALGPDNL
jgi:predicted metal-dependent hydrolase